MAYEPDTSTRYCNWTYVDEKDLPEGQKLRQCGRCKEVFYISREAQTLHWKQGHKKTCRPLDDEPVEMRSAMTLERCLEVMGIIMSDPMRCIQGRALLFCFQTLFRYLLDPSYFAPRAAQIQPMVERYVFGPLATQLFSERSNPTKFLNLFWSMPGAASYFLSGTLFMTNEMKRKKDQGIEVPRKVLYVANGNQHDADIHLPMVYWMTLGMLFDGCFQRSYTLEAARSPRNVALIRQTLEMACDPYSRASYPTFETSLATSSVTNRGHRFSTVLQFFLTGSREEVLAQLPSGALREGEIMPGLTLKQALQWFMEDEPFLASLPDRCFVYLYGVWKWTKKPDTGTPGVAFKSLSPPESIELIDLLHGWNIPPNLFEFPPHFVHISIHPRNIMLDVLLGKESKDLIALHNYLLNEGNLSPNPRTAEIIKEHYKSHIINPTMPLVAEYARIIEAKYLERRAGADGDAGVGRAQHLPRETMQLIAEFSARNSFQIVIMGDLSTT